MPTLVIRHIPDSSPPQFQLEREDYKSSQPVEVVSPFTFPVQDRPDGNLMVEMRWYLEKFLDYPFPPNTDKARAVLTALEGWRRQVFTALFGGGKANNWCFERTKSERGTLHLQVMSDDPQVLQWPWQSVYPGKNRRKDTNTVQNINSASALGVAIG